MRIHGLMYLAVVLFVTSGLTFAAERTELTEQDVTAQADWTGADVSLFGVHVGQDMEEAVKSLARHRLSLERRLPLRPGSDFFDARSVKAYVGITLELIDGKVFKILVLNEAQWDVPQAVLARRIKGRLSRLLFDYSDASRISLLGEPDRVDRHPTSVGADFADYYYDRRGLGVLVQRFADAKARDKGEASVTMVLTAPKEASQP